ncbi:hypothetical protein C1H46_002962 [Malus baccata]|uniref:Uncharacterized protein n=1 Tax=Malus baccata TaxID=106549 RepID=A0A540NK38_MALBA|nr:hypothetical protein C1H46_002962 [Malus baccata]
MADNGARSSKTTDGECSGKGVVKSDKRNSFSSDVGAMVCTKRAADWESWRAIPKELKMHMIDKLASGSLIMNALQHNSNNRQTNGR